MPPARWPTPRGALPPGSLPCLGHDRRQRRKYPRHVRDDGASPHTVDASFKKAYTSRSYRVPSADFMKRAEIGGGGRPGLRQINNVLGVPGGLPIKVGDETIGGIGVAGAPGDTGDESCAAAGIEKVKDQLK